MNFYPMENPMTVTDVATRKRGTPAHLQFASEISVAVYKAKINQVIAENSPSSYSRLATLFTDKFKCAVSTATMKDWCSHCGIELSTAVKWTNTGPSIDYIPITDGGT